MSSSTDLVQLLNEAAAAADSKEYMRATQIYTGLLGQTNPQMADVAVRDMRLTALRERAQLLHLLGEQEAALAGYEQYYLEAGSSRHALEALVLIGNQSAQMGRFARALEAQDEALQLAEALNDTAGRAKALGGTGVALIGLGRVEEALASLKKSLALFEQVGDRVEETRTWNRIGVAHIHLGEVDKAIIAFRKCSTLAREISDQGQTVWTSAIHALNNLGECYQSLFDMEQALIHHQEGLAIAESRELPTIVADLCRNLGVDLRHLDRIEDGLRYLYRALEISQATLRPDITFQTLYSLALAEMECGNLEKGYEHARELKMLAEQRNARGYQADALHALGLYHQLQGETTAAEQMWQQALFLAHETGRRMLLWQIHAALAGISPNPTLAGVHIRIAAEVIQQIAFPIADETLRQKFLNAASVRRVLDAVEE